MPFCPRCGREDELGASFCPGCGSSRITQVSAAAPTPAQVTATQPFAAQVATAAYLPGTRYIGKWNWGAFGLYPYWLMTHRKAPLGIALFLLALVPLANISGLAFSIYYGLHGNRIAVLSGRFTDEAQFVAVQNAWRNWTFGLLIASVILFTLAGVFGAIGGHK